MVKVKNKKRNLSEVTAKKRDNQRKKSLNPFEVHINREKQKILGRKNKADRGLPGVARSKAINKRKNTLLHEYKVKDKDNAFLDRRIGERNSALTQEDKVMARYAAERIKAHKKKNIFNLNDDEILTHGGQTLAEIEKFEDPRSDDEELSDDGNRTGKLDKKFVSEAHFGGGMLSKPDATLSRKDLIDQLIAESKKRKAEKQKMREQTIDLTEKLDTDWKDLLPIVSASRKTQEERNEKQQADDYDIALRQLKFEARGTPSDRLKSEEKIAKEEKETLEALEADRLARMKGFTDDSNAQTKHKSADDLDDGFVMENISEDLLTYGEDGLVSGVNENPDVADNESEEEKNSENGEDSGEDNESETEQRKVIDEHDELGKGEEIDADDDENSSEAEEDQSESEDSEMNEKQQSGTKDTLETTNTVSRKRKKDLIEHQIEQKRVIATSGKLKELKDPFDNIPVLKISDDVEESGIKTDKNKKVQVNDKNIISSRADETKSSYRKNVSKGTEPESESEDSESDDEEPENGSEESEEEDNLSDLKESDSSSEEDEPSMKKNVKFSKNLEKNKTILKSSDDKQPKSILKSNAEKEPDVQELSDTERVKNIKADLLKRKEIMEKARQELPYTYKAPESFEELEQLLQEQIPDYQSVIVERIIKCNHQSLGEENKEKLANLFAYLLQYFNDCAVEDGVENVAKCFQIFDRLCPHVYDLAHAKPLNAKICLQEVIKEKHEEFEKKQKKYPGLDTLLFLKLVSLLFPTSDFRHPVATPCLVFMSQILLRCRVRSRTDISKGLFVSTLLLEYTLLSKRFAPSVINFLRGVIHMATPKPPVQVMKIIPPFKSAGELTNLLIVDEDLTDLKVDPKSIHMNVADLVTDELDDDFKVRAFLTAVNLISEFKSQLEELEAAYSIFEPIIKLLRMNTLENYPKSVRKHVQSILKDLESLKDKKLEYIVLEKKRPKPLKLYEPRIETIYDGKRHRPMSKEKAQREKLVHKYKRELKGAIREVRRDRAFLAKVQIKQQIRSDEERKRKVKEIFGDAALQQGELNKIKRTK